MGPVVPIGVQAGLSREYSGVTAKAKSATLRSVMYSYLIHLRGGCRALLVGLFFVLTAGHAPGKAQFLFTDGNGLDRQGVGGSMTRKADNLIDVTLTTVDIVGLNGQLASAGAGHVMNSLPPGNVGDALGIDSSNSGAVNEARDFNAGEAWLFNFDVAVELVDIDFAGWGDTSSEVTISFSDRADTLILSGAAFNDTFPLGDTFVPAGTVITVALTNASGDREVRVKYLTVEPIPEPPTGIIYTDGDGAGDWTTPDPDFMEDGLQTDFNTGDDVIFPGPGNLAVIIDPDGVIAGNLAWTNVNNGTLKFVSAGSLVVENMTNTDRGGIRIENTTTINQVAKFLQNGEFEVGSTGNLTLGTLELGGGSRFEVEAGGVFNGLSAPVILGGRGAEIRNGGDLSLGPVINSFDENPLEKSGEGNLELTAGLGTVSTGPVELEISNGSVTISGTQPIYIGGASSFDGSLVMDGPLLELHGSTIEGTGSIVVRSPSLLSSRSGEGDNEIQVPILFEETLTVDLPSGADSLILRRSMSGPGGLIKKGSGVLEVDQVFEAIGARTGYEGDTQIESGTLRVNDPVLSSTAAVVFTPHVGGAFGNLDMRHGQGEMVNSLFIDGVQMAAGTYGSSSVIGTTLDVINDSRFKGNGWLIVLNDPPSEDYQGWADGFGLEGRIDQDDDHDGTLNGDEYIFGLDPTDASSVSPIAMPLDPASGSFSYTRRNVTVYATGVNYSYEYSLDLGEDWTDLTSDFTELSDNGDPVETITVTLPAPLLDNGRLFVRVNGE